MIETKKSKDSQLESVIIKKSSENPKIDVWNN